MKEKLKKIGKWFLIIVVTFLVVHEIYGLTIDIYNFRQLEKVKNIMTTQYQQKKNFNNLQEFNAENIKKYTKQFSLRNVIFNTLKFQYFRE